MIPYVDGAGLTLLVDRDALVRRSSGGGAPPADAAREVLDGINRHEHIAFGTHAGGEAVAIISLFPFDGADLLKYRVKSTFDAGLLRTGGHVVLCDRAQFTAAARAGGRLDEGPTAAKAYRVPAGVYRVLVHRSLSHDPAQDDGIRPMFNLIHLARVEEDTTVPAFTTVPCWDELRS